MFTQTDPYEAARMRNRFGNSYGGSQNFQQGAGGMSPAATAGRSPLRQRLPILPDQSEHPSVSPAGQGSSSGYSAQNQAAGAEAQDKLREQIQQSAAARAQQSVAQNAAAQREQAASIANYRTARDLGTGRDSAIESGRLKQQATELGIDPASDEKTVAAAASGKVGFNAQGLPMGGDTQQAGPSTTGAGPQPPASTPGNVQATPSGITNAVQQIQAEKDGAQRLAAAQATSTGLGIKSPFSSAMPQPSTTAPMALRDGTTGSAPPPAPVAAPMPAPTFAPAYKLRKPRPGFAGADDTDPASQPA
jgi:hypothetical protein